MQKVYVPVGISIDEKVDRCYTASSGAIVGIFLYRQRTEWFFMEQTDKKIGFLVNPIAGLGGQAGMLGSDNRERRREALRKGYQKTAFKRALECLEQIKSLGNAWENGYQIYAPEGEMGGEVLKAAKIPYQSLGNRTDDRREGQETSREDTLYFLELFKKIKVDLLVFCGGDGTARDICEAAGESIHVLGVPAGVKMYSACFAVNPWQAGEMLKWFLQGKQTAFTPREVMDIDEKDLDRSSVSPALYGFLMAPDDRVRLQRAKEAGVSDKEETDSLVRDILSEMRDHTLYILGPGSTTYHIKQELRGTGSIRGVDLAEDGEIFLRDVDEKTIYSCLKDAKCSEIIVTCIGGNGFLFGRGNQQISPRIIRMNGKEHIRLAVTKSKLAGLGGRPMLVDTGDPDTDRYLSGYYRIRLNAKEEIIYRVETGANQSF